jgi:hypothetical protein
VEILLQSSDAHYRPHPRRALNHGHHEAQGIPDFQASPPVYKFIDTAHASMKFLRMTRSIRHLMTPSLINLGTTIIGSLQEFSYLQKSDRSSCYETCQRHDKKPCPIQRIEVLTKTVGVELP